MKISKPKDLVAETGALLRAAVRSVAKATAEVGSRSELPTQTAPLEVAIALYGDALIAHYNAIEARKKELAK